MCPFVLEYNLVLETRVFQGMGKARIKDKRAPQHKFGGVPLGLRPRDYGYDIAPSDLVTGFSVSPTLITNHGVHYFKFS